MKAPTKKPISEVISFSPSIFPANNNPLHNANTYAELSGQVEALATAFQAIDPEPQSRVGICAYNTIEHMVAVLAVTLLGLSASQRRPSGRGCLPA